MSARIPQLAGGGIAGPVSSTDNALVRWDGTGGATVKDSGTTLDNSNNLTVPGVVSSPGAGVASETFGVNSSAGGILSVALGRSCTAGPGASSSALGNGCTASANWATAVGRTCQATAQGAFCGGSASLASGANSVALGQAAIASGSASFALGFQATALVQALALGEGSAANGTASIAQGVDSETKAGATASIALGRNCIVDGAGLFAAGDGATIGTTGTPGPCLRGVALGAGVSIDGGRDD
jgi:hypothetical protein